MWVRRLMVLSCAWVGCLVDFGMVFSLERVSAEATLELPLSLPFPALELPLKAALELPLPLPCPALELPFEAALELPLPCPALP